MNQMRRVRNSPFPTREDVDMENTDLKDLMQILSYRRKAGSKGEEMFINNFLIPSGLDQDQCGNLYGDVGLDPTICFMSHTDTMHRRDGMQTIRTDSVGRLKSAGKDVLGADDGAGVWIMWSLFNSGFPARYIFHRGEENCCVGSGWIVDHAPYMVDGIKCAISLDRAGFDEVITHQSGNRCASDKFAQSLGDQIGLNFRPSPNGSYTDSAMYRGIIGECVNLSVGYEFAHSNREILDASFVIKLRDSLLKLDPDKLIFERKPADDDQDAMFDDWFNGFSSSDSHKSGDLFDKKFEDMVQVIQNDPDGVAAILLDLGMSAGDVEGYRTTYEDRILS